VGRADFQTLAVCSYVHRHQAIVRIRIEQLFAISAPLGVISTPRGNLKAGCWSREGDGINLTLAGFVRDLGHPLAIRRELAEVVIEVRRD
jgi:hypothetical protein